jgi:hypothetical protein
MAAPGSPLIQEFSTLASITLRNIGKNVADNLTTHNALYNRMVGKGKQRTEDGGLSIVQILDYAANSTYQRFSGYDVLQVAASEILTSAEFQWRNIALNVTANGTELRQNSGDSAFKNLVKSKITNALRTGQNNFSGDLYSDGTLPNQINGIQALVPDVNTSGTVGSINCATWPFWQTKLSKRSAPIQGGTITTLDKSTIEACMRALYFSLTRNNDQPNLILTDANLFSIYEDSQVSLKRYMADDNGGSFKGDGGFLTLKYKNCDVMFDGVSNIPANHMYFLNTDYFNLVAHSSANWTQGEEVRPYNMDAVVIPILWMGNLVISNRSLQGVFIAD